MFAARSVASETGRGWCRSQAFHPRGFGSNPQPVHLLPDATESVYRAYRPFLLL